MMGPMLSAVCRMMADNLRPRIEEMAINLYRNRSGGKLPTEIRLNDLVDKATIEMCKAIERAFDLELPADQAQKAAMSAIADYLTTELDGEFRFILIQ